MCREKIEIPATMAYVSLEGAGASKTIIQWDDTADRKGKDGLPLGTYASATFAVNAPYFIAKYITFKVSTAAVIICSIKLLASYSFPTYIFFLAYLTSGGLKI